MLPPPFAPEALVRDSSRDQRAIDREVFLRQQRLHLRMIQPQLCDPVYKNSRTAHLLKITTDAQNTPFPVWD